MLTLQAKCAVALLFMLTLFGTNVIIFQCNGGLIQTGKGRRSFPNTSEIIEVVLTHIRFTELHGNEV